MVLKYTNTVFGDGRNIKGIFGGFVGGFFFVCSSTAEEKLRLWYNIRVAIKFVIRNQCCLCDVCITNSALGLQNGPRSTGVQKVFCLFTSMMINKYL